MKIQKFSDSAPEKILESMGSTSRFPVTGLGVSPKPVFFNFTKPIANLTTPRAQKKSLRTYQNINDLLHSQIPLSKSQERLRMFQIGHHRRCH